jgi:hypothetical protein
MNRRDLTPNDLPLWLHDRLGRIVQVELTIDHGPFSGPALVATGELSHASAAFDLACSSANPDLVAGTYGIGGTVVLNVTDFDGLDVVAVTSPDATEFVEVALANGVTLHVSEAS